MNNHVAAVVFAAPVVGARIARLGLGQCRIEIAYPKPETI